MSKQISLGIDIGGTNTAIGTVAKDGTVINKTSIPIFSQNRKPVSHFCIPLLLLCNIKLNNSCEQGTGNCTVIA